MKSRIVIVGAGGTIAMQGAHPFDWVDYGDTGIINSPETVIDGMDFSLDGVVVETIAFRQLPSTGITLSDWCDLSSLITSLADRGDVDGVVITHGTATLEETAFFLKATYRVKLPVIVCGAQRPPNTIASDAQSGLRSALSAAAQAPAGVYVAMNGYIYDPNDVTKSANFSLDAFEAPEFGPIARVEPSGRLVFQRQSRENPYCFDVSTLVPEKAPRVDIVHSYVGADGTAIDAFVSIGSSSIISVGFPPGRCTPQERASLIRARDAGVLVVQTSRALRGAVPVQPYNREEGILAGGGLSPNKARILVLLALAEECSPAEIESFLVGW